MIGRQGVLPLIESDIPMVGLSATMYTDEFSPRTQAAFETAQAFKDMSVPLVLIDSGSAPNVVDRLRKLGAVVVEVGALGGQAFQYMQGINLLKQAVVSPQRLHVCKFELEKNVAPFARRIVEVAQRKAITVVTRASRVRPLMPLALEVAERYGGDFLYEHLGISRDAMFGVVVYSPESLELWAVYQKLVETLGSQHPALKQWCYLYLLPLMAQERGWDVAEVEIDYLYPLAIVREEDASQTFTDKRRVQLTTQLQALMALRPELIKGDPQSILNAAVAHYNAELA